jgi:hypothetical protein
MDLVAVLKWMGVFVVLYILYMYFYGSSGKSSLYDIHSATQNVKISPSKAPAGSTADMTYSIWFFVDDWNYRYGLTKHVFMRLSPRDTPAPSVSFAPYINNLEIKMSSFHKDSSGVDITHITVPDVPLQRWTNLIISLNGRAMDIYLDGKLVRTMLLAGVPVLSTTTPIELTPDGGFSGQTANFTYMSRAVNPQEAYDIYRQGSGVDSFWSRLFNKYRIKIAFMEDNRELNSLQI